MNYSLYVLLLTLSYCAISAQIYKWTDSEDHVHFSDKPHQGAEAVNIPDAPAYTASLPSVIKSKNNRPKEGEVDATYELIEIIQPKMQATIRNNQGLVDVLAKVTPELKEGHKLQIIYDGQTSGVPQSSPHFILTNVYRGEHTIAVQIENARGEVVKTSESVTIYMHRPRVGMVPQTRSRQFSPTF